MGRLFAWTKILVIGAAVLLSPLFAFLTAIAAEILVGVAQDTGALAFVVVIVAGAIGCTRFQRQPAGPQSRAPIAI